MTEIILLSVLKELVRIFTMQIKLYVPEFSGVEEFRHSMCGIPPRSVSIKGEIDFLERVAPGSIHCNIRNSRTSTANRNHRNLEDLPEAEGIDFSFRDDQSFTFTGRKPITPEQTSFLRASTLNPKEFFLIY